MDKTGVKINLGRMPAIGVDIPEKILLCLPKGVHDYRSPIEKITWADRRKGRQLYLLRLTSAPNMASVSPPRAEVMATDGHAEIKLTVFGNTHLWMKLRPGQIIYAEGEVQEYGGKLYLSSPVNVNACDVGKVLPYYKGKKGVLAAETVFDKTRLALEQEMTNTVTYLCSIFEGTIDEQEICQSAGIKASLEETLRFIHEPSTLEQWRQGIDNAKKLAAYEVVWRGRRAQCQVNNPGSIIAIEEKAIDQILSHLPFKLMAGQHNAINDIVDELKSNIPMRRLLSGDVGTGKSAVILSTALAARNTGAHVAILVPNVLIVRQLVHEASLFNQALNVLAITAETRISHQELECNPLIIGTTAIVSQLTKLNWGIDYIVIDEQHKFSREQREGLMASHTNFLEATATCIPRTMGLITHAGMGVSILNERPAKRRITTRLLGEKDKKRMFQHIIKTIESGKQAAVVYPKVEQGDVQDNGPIKSLIEASVVWQKHFPGRVAILHGRMSDEEKSDVIQGMKAGKYDLLISTTVIELGITLPSLRTMSVIGADRFGTSTLHQLRGRIARHGGSGDMHLYHQKELEPETLARLNLVVQNDDGFALSEADMRMRGFGNMADDSEDQSGRTISLFIGLKITPDDLSQFVSNDRDAKNI